MYWLVLNTSNRVTENLVNIKERHDSYPITYLEGFHTLAYFYMNTCAFVDGDRTPNVNMSGAPKSPYIIWMSDEQRPVTLNLTNVSQVLQKRISFW